MWCAIVWRLRFCDGVMMMMIADDDNDDDARKQTLRIRSPPLGYSRWDMMCGTILWCEAAPLTASCVSLRLRKRRCARRDDWWEGATGVCFGSDSHLLYIYNYLYIFSIHIFFILPLIFLVCSLFHIYTKLVTTRYDKSEDYIGLPVFLSCFRLFVSDVCFLGIDVSSALATWIWFQPFFIFSLPSSFTRLFHCVGGKWLCGNGSNVGMTSGELVVEKGHMILPIALTDWWKDLGVSNISEKR